MKGNNGQTLLEMVVVLGILAIVIFALVGVTTISIRNAGFSRNQVLATKYAQQAIEKIRASREQSTWGEFRETCSLVISGISLPGPFYFSPETGCNCLDDVCEVKVAVLWNDSGGPHKSELTTRLTKKK